MSAALVQSASVETTYVPQAITFSPVTAGNLIVIAGYYDLSSVITMTVGSGYTALTNISNANGSIRMWYKIAAGGETTVTIDGGAVAMAEYSGVQPSPLDVENAVSTASGTVHTTPTLTPVSGLPELLVFASLVKVTSGNSWSGESVNGSTAGVNERQDLQTAHLGLQLSDLSISSTSGTYNASATSSGSSTGAAAIAMFKTFADVGVALRNDANRPFGPF